MLTTLSGLKPINSLKWRVTIIEENEKGIKEERIEEMRLITPNGLDHCVKAELVTDGANYLLRIGDALFTSKDRPDLSSLTTDGFLVLDLGRFGTRYYNMNMIATVDVVKIEKLYEKKNGGGDD
jgi:hypothetical protein